MSQIRQYIGARYVLKIYENSVDPLSADWEANTSYEPLTMVNYNNSSYISRKEVPANIGNPVDNPTYWALSGLYNGQIAHLQDQIDTHTEYINDLKAIAYNVMESDIDNTGDEDCSSILQDLVDTYNCLYFPPGTYKIDTPVNITKNVSIIGDGATINFSGWGAFNYSYTSQHCVYGLKFMSTKNLSNCAISVGNGNNINIENCIFDTVGYGISTYLSKNIHVNNCLFTDMYYGVVFDGTTKYDSVNRYNSVTNCVTKNSERECLYFRYANKCFAQNNYNTNSGSYAVAAQLSQEITINDNYSEMSAGEGFNLQDCELSKICHNTAIWYPSEASYGVSRGVDFGISIWGTHEGNPDNVSVYNEISENLIIDSNKAGIAISDDTQKDIIRDNILINCAHNTNSTEAGNGAISVGDWMESGIAPSVTKIIGNVITGTASYGIYLRPAKHWETSIYDNIVENVTTYVNTLTLPTDKIGGNTFSYLEQVTPSIANATLDAHRTFISVDKDKMYFFGDIQISSATAGVQVSLPQPAINGIVYEMSCTGLGASNVKAIVESANYFTVYSDSKGIPADGYFTFKMCYKFK